MYSYFHRTELDKKFFDDNLCSRLPCEIIDAHAHFNLPKHVERVTKETLAGDWALECGLLMSYEDARQYTSVMFEEKRVNFVALPWPLREADTVGNNAYISSIINDKNQYGLFTVRPEFSIQMIEKEFVEGRFNGFKPYPYMASAIKGAEVSIFDFMPHEQFRLANKLKTAVLMHLPRAGRLPDPDNISEIRVILDKYPDVKLVIAHFGRCFQQEYFEMALEALKNDVDRVWFDTAAVLNPKVYELVKAHVNSKRVIFGTDLPIMLWHGKREWDDAGYHNLCREDFSWNKHKYPEDEENYTYFVYEQINNILNTYGDNEDIINDIFRRNAQHVYGAQL